MHLLFRRLSSVVLFALATKVLVSPVLAETVAKDAVAVAVAVEVEVEEIIVWRCASAKKGLAGTASEGLIGDTDFSDFLLDQLPPNMTRWLVLEPQVSSSEVDG